MEARAGTQNSTPAMVQGAAGGDERGNLLPRPAFPRGRDVERGCRQEDQTVTLLEIALCAVASPSGGAIRRSGTCLDHGHSCTMFVYNSFLWRPWRESRCQ